MKIPVIYNIRSLRQRPATSAATITGFALVVLTFVGMLALAAGFRQAMIRTGRADNVLVLRAGSDVELNSGVARDEASIIKTTPYVAKAPDGSPMATADVYVVVTMSRTVAGGSQANVPVRGVDFAAFSVRDQVRITDGRIFERGRAEIIVGTGIARRVAGVNVGDVVELGNGSFNVVGHFEADGGAFESEIWGENVQLMDVFRGPVFQSITFRLADPAAFDSANSALERNPHLRVEASREDDFFRGQSALLGTVLNFLAFFVTGIMAIGAIFGAINTMDAMVSARSREIALLLTLGFRPRSVMGSFLVEAVLLALAGGLLGCLLALPLNGIATSTTNWQSFAELSFTVRVTPTVLAQGLAFAAVMGVIGGLLPARHAARQVIAAALRNP
jgi:putative ABC transport system permease protein